MTPVQEQADGVLTVGVDESPPPPLCFGLPGSSDFRGFEVDLMESLAAKLGLRLRWRSVYWRVAIELLRRGRLDAICTAATITPARLQQVDFTDPYLESALVIVTRDVAAGGPAWLEERRVGVRLATVAEAFVNGRRPVTVAGYELNERAYQALEQGHLDAVVDDLAIAKYFATHRPRLRLSAPLDGTRACYGIVVPKGNDVLRERLNGALARLLADGTWARLRLRWNVEVPPA